MTMFAPLLAAVLAQSPAAPSTGPAGPASAASPATIRAVAEGNRGFALDLYRRLRPDADGNIFFSPVSIATAFGPASAGARGPTLAAIGQVLHYPETGPALHAVLGGLGAALVRHNDGIEVRIANTLWVGRLLEPRPDYLALTREAYGTAVERVDFSQAEAAAARINARVGDQTNGRITDLVSPDALPPNTGMVITNAVYFLADWASPFDADDTRPAPFTLATGAQVTAPLMAATGDFAYYRGRDFAALDLPYRDGTYVMTVLLPDRADGLPALERSLTPPLLDGIFTALDSTGDESGRHPWSRVDLLLPRLELRTGYSLGGTLSAMGMAPAFAPAADFSALSPIPVAISDVIHKTFLRISEEGTEAAAATSVGVVVSGARIDRRRPIVFHADHPFLILLRERETGAILFMGRIARPRPPAGAGDPAP
jgi:serpin B